MRSSVIVYAAIAMCAAASVSQANHVYNFTAFDSGGQFTEIAGLNLSVDVYAEGPRAVFEFKNSSIITPIITDIYFQDGDLLKIASIHWGDQPNVRFSPGATPPDLPGGQALNFHVTNPLEYFAADADKLKNGIGKDNWLIIKYDLKDGGTVDRVISQLNSGGIRIGLHVQGFSGPVGSYSAINTVPEPATMALLGLGAMLLRKRKN